MVTEARHCHHINHYINYHDEGIYYLEEGDEIVIIILKLRPALEQWRHEDLDIRRVLQCCANSICERADGIVEDEHVLVLVFVEREDKVSQHRLKVWHELRTRIFFKGREGTAPCFLHTLVVV